MQYQNHQVLASKKNISLPAESNMVVVIWLMSVWMKAMF